MRDLKPCPFCGGKAAIYATTTNTIPYHCKHFCYCTKCNSSGKSFEDRKNDGSSVFEAIEAWNMRAQE